MASPDLNPMVYDFRFTYYQNYYRNRKTMMSTSGEFYHMFMGPWSSIDSIAESSDGLGTDPIIVNNGIDIEWYVKKNFNSVISLYSRVGFLSARAVCLWPNQYSSVSG